MKAILADNDVEGILAALVSIWLSDTWRDLWIELNCSLETFPSLDLPRNASDAVLGGLPEPPNRLDHRQPERRESRVPGGDHPKPEPA